MILYYHEHCENLRLIQSSISSVRVTLKSSISNQNEVEVEIYTKILSFLVNSWTEVRIMKLINENNAFTEFEIKTIIESRSLENKWKKTLEIAYNKSFQNNSNNPKNKARFDSLMDIISDHLKYSAEIRNKLAHGQWKHSFNNKSLAINPDLTRRVNSDNYTKIRFRYEIFKILSQIIHDLAVSTPTFERDFEKNYNRIVQRQQYVHNNKKHEDFVERLVSKKIDYKQNKKHVE